MKTGYAAAVLVLAFFLVFPAFGQETPPALSGTLRCVDASYDVTSARATYWFDEGVSISVFSNPKGLGKAFARIMLEMDKNRSRVGGMRLTCTSKNGTHAVTAKADDGGLEKMLVSWKLENNILSLHTRGKDPSGAGSPQAEWDLKIDGLPVK